jgi:hypothetical protein
MPLTFALATAAILAAKHSILYFQVYLHLWTLLNQLMFIACLFTLWVDILVGLVDPESCLLSQTHSASAAGWLWEYKFSDMAEEMVQLTMARQNRVGYSPPKERTMQNHHTDSNAWSIPQFPNTGNNLMPGTNLQTSGGLSNTSTNIVSIESWPS